MIFRLDHMTLQLKKTLNIKHKHWKIIIRRKMEKQVEKITLLRSTKLLVEKKE